MSEVQVERLRSNYLTIRQGNHKTRTSFWAYGHRLFLACSVALIFMGFALVFVWSNYQAVQLGYVIAQLHQEKTQLKEINRKLKLELANLSALDRLEQIAKNKLGLQTPQPDQIQVIE